jgi:uncharacterized protein YjbI with pentapeptide repeats
MANDEHVELLKQGVAAWNAWRDENPDIRPDLQGANLSEANLNRANLMEADLSEANLTKADLSGAKLFGVDLFRANLSGADLSGADLSGQANLLGADLSGANLQSAQLDSATLCGVDLLNADLRRANLFGADLQGADLRQANLRFTNLLDADLRNADLTGSLVFGTSAWNLKLEGTAQRDLVITEFNQPPVTVDNIEVAQFIHLLLHNEKIRDVIDTIGKKGVLLLGRFTEGRMVVLERLRDKLRDIGFVPIVFNFDKPETKDFTETVRLLCNLSHFVIVDITNPRSAPLELQATVPDYMVPFAPILQQGEEPFAMFVDLQNKYDWVLKTIIGYPSVDRLLEVLEDEIIKPAERKFNELLERRKQGLLVKNV